MQTNTLAENTLDIQDSERVDVVLLTLHLAARKERGATEFSYKY